MEKNDLLALKNFLTTKNKTDKTFTEYCQVYPYTNEMLSSIFMDCDGTNKNALTVLSSGDQVFDLVFLGFNDITAFDCNRFTRYFFELKKAAVLNLSYEEYLNFISLNGFISDEYIMNLIPYMNHECQEFWILYLSMKEDRVNNLFVSEIYKKVFPKDINYLINEDNYNLLKSRLNDVNIEFINSDIVDLTPYVGEYDFIYLSNISDYLGRKNNKKVIYSLLNYHLKDNGQLYVVGTCPINNFFTHYYECFESLDHWYYTKIYKDNMIKARILNRNNKHSI